MSVENNPSMKKVKHFIFEWLIPIALALIIALLIRHFVAFTFNVPTTSMYPTINAGDFGIATKVYNKNSLKRGDVVVFKSEELNMVLVKRLIGLPGDKVSIKDNGDVVGVPNIDKIQLRPVMLLTNSLDKERMETQSLSTTFSRVGKISFRKPDFLISFHICSIGFISGVYGGIPTNFMFFGTFKSFDLCQLALSPHNTM